MFFTAASAGIGAGVAAIKGTDIADGAAQGAIFGGILAGSVIGGAGLGLGAGSVSTFFAGLATAGQGTWAGWVAGIASTAFGSFSGGVISVGASSSVVLNAIGQASSGQGIDAGQLAISGGIGALGAGLGNGLTSLSGAVIRASAGLGFRASFALGGLVEIAGQAALGAGLGALEASATGGNVENAAAWGGAFGAFTGLLTAGAAYRGAVTIRTRNTRLSHNYQKAAVRVNELGGSRREVDAIGFMIDTDDMVYSVGGKTIKPTEIEGAGTIDEFRRMLPEGRIYVSGSSKRALSPSGTSSYFNNVAWRRTAKEIGFLRPDSAFKYRQFSNTSGSPDPRALSYLFLGPALAVNIFSRFIPLPKL